MALFGIVAWFRDKTQQSCPGCVSENQLGAALRRSDSPPARAGGGRLCQRHRRARVRKRSLPDGVMEHSQQRRLQVSSMPSSPRLYRHQLKATSLEDGVVDEVRVRQLNATIAAEYNRVFAGLFGPVSGEDGAGAVATSLQRLPRSFNQCQSSSSPKQPLTIRDGLLLDRQFFGHGEGRGFLPDLTAPHMYEKPAGIQRPTAPSTVFPQCSAVRHADCVADASAVSSVSTEFPPLAVPVMAGEVSEASAMSLHSDACRLPWSDEDPSMASVEDVEMGWPSQAAGDQSLLLPCTCQCTCSLADPGSQPLVEDSFSQLSLRSLSPDPRPSASVLLCCPASARSPAGLARPQQQHRRLDMTSRRPCQVPP